MQQCAAYFLGAIDCMQYLRGRGQTFTECAWIHLDPVFEGFRQDLTPIRTDSDAGQSREATWPGVTQLMFRGGLKSCNFVYDETVCYYFKYSSIILCHVV